MEQKNLGGGRGGGGGKGEWGGQGTFAPRH